ERINESDCLTFNGNYPFIDARYERSNQRSDGASSTQRCLLSVDKDFITRKTVGMTRYVRYTTPFFPLRGLRNSSFRLICRERKNIADSSSTCSSSRTVIPNDLASDCCS